MHKDWIEEQTANESEGLFLKQIIARVLVLWPWLIVSVAVCVTGMYFLLRYDTPEYKVKASILVQDDRKGTNDIGAAMLQDFGLVTGGSSVDNEAEIFKSRTLMKTVVETQQLFIRYYVPGNIKATEVFQNRPITFQYVDVGPEVAKRKGEYNMAFDQKDPSLFTLTVNDVAYKGRLGDTITLPHEHVLVSVNPAAISRPAKGDVINVVVVPVQRAVSEYMSRLDVAIPNKLVSVINLTLDEIIPQKGEIVLNALINTYLQGNVNDKNRIVDSTIKFIDERLGLVTRELFVIEKDIEKFRTVNKLTDISEQSRLLLSNTSDYMKQQTSQEVQMQVLQSLEKFLKDNQNSDRIVPSSLVMQDPAFIALIQKYNDMQLIRDKMLMSLTAQHPSVQNIDEQLRNLRSEVLSSIQSVKRGINVSIGELKKQTSGFERQISNVPAKERVWLDYSRQQAIKQELYLFLLKKREESAISKSSTIANARVIDHSQSDSAPFKPKKSFFLAISFIAGLIIPFAFSFVRDFFNIKIKGVDDIEHYTSTPILAEIGHSEEDNPIVVTHNSRSVISEQFRALRTDMRFLMPAVDSKVILITSSMSGEGKSFLSTNLCSAFALASKKIILLELDLRKPKISETLKLNQLGITNYLIDSDYNWKKWIQTYSSGEGKFDVLSSGPLPPNPAELLMLPKLAQLFKELRENYDYIIIDSAPVGLVTDAQILAAFADITLYVVRPGLTYKQQVALIDKLYKKSALPHMNVVVNDVRARRNRYEYGYYGYGYGVYGS